MFHLMRPVLKVKSFKEKLYSAIQKKLLKILRIWLIPFLFFVLVLVFAAIVLKWYLRLTDMEQKIYQMPVEAIMTFLAAFSGIFIPVLIDRNLDKEKDRRTLAFTLGLIWHELLYNEYILQEMSGNLNVDKFCSETDVAFVVAIKVLEKKVDSVSSLMNLLSTESFLASQGSGAIKTINSDDLLNSLIETYQAIKDVQYRFFILLGNAKKNRDLIETNQTIKFDENTENKIKEMIKKDTDDTIRKISTVLARVRYAIKRSDNTLNELGVKTELK